MTLKLTPKFRRPNLSIQQKGAGIDSSPEKSLSCLRPLAFIGVVVLILSLADAHAEFSSNPANLYLDVDRVLMVSPSHLGYLVALSGPVKCLDENRCRFDSISFLKIPINVTQLPIGIRRLLVTRCRYRRCGITVKGLLSENDVLALDVIGLNRL
nr:hypothetical protein [uncultured Rhodopila sp.]